MEAVLAQLKSLPYVDSAYAMPRCVPAASGKKDIPDLRSNQGYLKQAQVGVNAYYAWEQKGGNGKGITVADIGGAWNTKHADLRSAKPTQVYGVTMEKEEGDWYDHGTAMLGVIAGTANKFGVTGIAYKSKLKMYSIGRKQGNKIYTNVADAISQATAGLRPGDIMVIGLQCEGLKKKEDYIPVEYYDAEFDAIKAATDKGIIVIEAAGDGGQDLDAALYKGLFNLDVRDSGAIMVGAGAAKVKLKNASATAAPDRSRLSFSNYGSRVDVQGWGHYVATTGYGDLYDGGNENYAFTNTFDGTSSASAMVAGAASCLQGVAKTRLITPLTSVEARKVLAVTGSPQAGNKSENIGARPNLKRATDDLEKVVYTMRPPEVMLPVDGFNWRTHTKQRITWRNYVGNTVTLALFQDGQLNQVLTTSEPNDYATTWGLAGNGTGYQIKVTSNVDAARFAFSGTFNLVGECPVTSPAKDSICRLTEVMAVRWSYVTGQTVTIELVNRANGNTRQIATAAPNNGVFNYTIPKDCEVGNSFFVRIQSNSDDSACYSDNFAIDKPIPRVTAPAEGFQWRSYTFQPIRWSGFLSNTVRIDLYQNSNFLQNCEYYEENDSYLSWPLHGSGSNLQFRVRSNSDYSRFAFSGNFTVSGTCPITQPSSTSRIPQASTLSIRWTYVSGTYVAILLGDYNTGNAWWVTQLTYNDGAYDVYIPFLQPTSNRYFLLIGSLTNDTAAYSEEFAIIPYGSTTPPAGDTEPLKPMAPGSDPRMKMLLNKVKLSPPAEADIKISSASTKSYKTEIVEMEDK